MAFAAEKAIVEDLYSFIIDGGEAFARETRVFLTTLLHTGVRPDRIVAHCTPNASPEAIGLAASRGVRISPIDRFLDGRYCNKLLQLDKLLETPASSYVLCDTDLAFAGSLDPLLPARNIRAKPVDFPNPPLEILERIRSAAGITTSPRLVPVTCAAASTWSVNCNGGLYVIPAAHAAEIGQQWKHFAVHIGDPPTILGNFRHHLDQVSFALAMLALRLDVETLPVEFNFPLHVAPHGTQFLFDEPRVLHYHRLLREDLTLPLTGDSTVDHAIARVNALMSQS